VSRSGRGRKACKCSAEVTIVLACCCYSCAAHAARAELLTSPPFPAVDSMSSFGIGKSPVQPLSAMWDASKEVTMLLLLLVLLLLLLVLTLSLFLSGPVAQKLVREDAAGRAVQPF